MVVVKALSKAYEQLRRCRGVAEQPTEKLYNEAIAEFFFWKALQIFYEIASCGTHEKSSEITEVRDFVLSPVIAERMTAAKDEKDAYKDVQEMVINLREDGKSILKSKEQLF